MEKGGHTLTVFLEVCSRFTIAPQEMGPATIGPQWCLAQDAEWAVGVQSLITGSAWRPCSHEACKPLPNLTQNLVLASLLTTR